MFLLRHAWPPIGKIEALIGIDEQPPAATKNQRIILSCRYFARLSSILDDKIFKRPLLQLPLYDGIDSRL